MSFLEPPTVEPANLARPEVEQQVPEIVHDVLATPGQPLDEVTRAWTRSRFDTDFSRVRVHTDDRSAESARAVSARAYTVGRHIVFGAGSYAPHSAAGRRLLIHELTHVVQQGQVDPGRHLPMTRPGDAVEVAAARIASGHTQVGTTSAGPVLARTPLTDTPRQPTLDQPRPSPSAQPSIGPGRLGDVVMHLPDWQFLPMQTFVHPLLDYAANATLLEALVVPELGVVLKVDGNAHAKASLGGSYDGWLHNITIGLTEDQASSVARFEFFGNNGPDQQSNRDLDDVAGIVRNFSGLADLDVVGRLGGTVDLSADLSAAASVAGLFDVAGVRAGLTAHASAAAQLAFHDTVGIYNVDGKYHFQDHPALTLTVPLRFDLTAFLDANLLGAHWRDEWQLAQYAKNWEFGANLDVRYDNAGTRTSKVTMSKHATDIIELVHDMLITARGRTHLDPVPGGPAGLGPGGPGAPSGAAGPPTPPTGRSPNDPIPMGWYKSPGRYPNVVLDDGLVHYFARPSWVTVPPTPALADLRRFADRKSNGDEQFRIGIDPSGPYYPRLRGPAWRRIRGFRRGIVQRQFRLLLRLHGFNWSGYEADHSRDVQWSGDDTYANMWPLDETTNGGATDAVLSQMVTYTDATGAVRNTDIYNTPLGLHFQIVRYM